MALSPLADDVAARDGRLIVALQRAVLPTIDTAGGPSGADFVLTTTASFKARRQKVIACEGAVAAHAHPAALHVYAAPRSLASSTWRTRRERVSGVNGF